MKLNFIKDQTINSWNNREIINKFCIVRELFSIGPISMKFWIRVMKLDDVFVQ